MPDSNQKNAISRQWEMLRMLPSSPPGISSAGITARLNADGFNIHKRSVERNLNDLSGIFGITYTEDSKDNKSFRWHWMPKAGLDIRSLTVAEAISTRLVEELLRPLLPPALLEPLEDRFSHAKKKIDELSSQVPMARWINKVRYVSPGYPRVEPVIEPKVLETVHQALFEDRQFKIDYKNATGEIKLGLTLNPKALIQKGSVGYLVATASDYVDSRFFALHRMKNPELTYEPSKSHSSFNLDDFLSNGEHQFKTKKNASIQLKAWVNTSEMEYSLKERPLSVDQKMETLNNQIQLTATVNESLDLVCWIMSMGPALTVVEPSSLREKIISKLRKQMDQYGLNDEYGKSSSSIQ